MDTKEKNSFKYDYIDTLRFFAIFFIVFTHFDNECFQYFMGNTFWQTYFSSNHFVGWFLYGLNGKAVLALLCVISGFLSKLNCSKKRECDAGVFLITRYLRLMLPVFGANLFFGTWLSLRGETIDKWQYFRASIVPGINDVNRNLWCIESFLLGNLLICLIEVIYRKNKWANWLYFPCLFVLFLLKETWVFAVVAGGLSFVIAKYCKEKKLLHMGWLIGILPAVWWLSRGEESILFYYRNIAASVLLMIAFYCLLPLQRIFAWKALAPIKKWSYSLFVVHGMTLFLVGPAWTLIQKIGVKSYAGTFFSLFAVVFFIDLLIAVVLYYIFEVIIYRTIINKLFGRQNKKEEIQLDEEDQQLVS